MANASCGGAWGSSAHLADCRVGSGVVRIDPLRFLTGCRTKSTKLSVLSLS